MEENYRDMMVCLGLLSRCVRLTAHERDCVKYALVWLDRIEQTFYEKGD